MNVHAKFSLLFVSFSVLKLPLSSQFVVVSNVFILACKIVAAHVNLRCVIDYFLHVNEELVFFHASSATLWKTYISLQRCT